MRLAQTAACPVSDYGLPWPVAQLFGHRPLEHLFAQEPLMSFEDFDLVRLSRVRERELPTLKGVSRRPPVIFKSDATWSLELLDTFEESCMHLSKKRLADTRRKYRKLDKMGRLVFAQIDDDTRKRRVIDWILKVKKLRYGSQYDVHTRSGKRYHEFYSTLASSKYADISFPVHVLTLNGQLLAAHWGIIFDQSFFWVLPATHPKFNPSLSVGRILMEKLIAESINRHLKRFDFTRGFHNYKYEWSTHVESLYEVFFPTTKIGHTYVKMLQTYYKLKSIKHKFEKRPNQVKHLKLDTSE